jgi:Zn-finger nucleic acid-binding protein
MTCQNCGAALRLDRDQGLMVCDYCGTQSTPPADEDGVQITGETTHPCPVCPKPLSTGRIEAHDLLYCTTCHGILIGMDDFVSLVESLREHRGRAASFLSPRVETESGQELRCPLCQGAMDHHPYGGGGNVMVYSCENCSQLWLERGVLRRVVIAPDSEPVYSNYGGSGQSSVDEL